MLENQKQSIPVLIEDLGMIYLMKIQSVKLDLGYIVVNVVLSLKQ